jgi:hypothetical protein
MQQNILNLNLNLNLNLYLLSKAKIFKKHFQHVYNNSTILYQYQNDTDYVINNIKISKVINNFTRSILI